MEIDPILSAQPLLIVYEYPLNERIRTLLRLEDLFDRLDLFAGREDAQDHHVALTTLFDILEVSSRADLKADLLQELDRQRVALAQFRDNPQVAAAALDAVLQQIESAWNTLNATTGRSGQHLRDNEWLMSIRSRSIIAGGACEFDLPSYYAWQNRSAAARQHDIAQWAAPLRPLHRAVVIVLRLLRESAQPTRIEAQQGSFQQPLSGRTYQMAQVRLDPAQGAIPEISANRYLLWIRFTAQDGYLRPRAFEGAVTFDLSLCNF